MFTGVDTGFFFALEEENPVAVKIWQERDIVTSVIVIYELRKKLLQSKFGGWQTIIEDIKKAVFVVSINEKSALNAADIGHTIGMPGLDALILSSLLDAGCKEIYTTDSHFEMYKQKGINIINLSMKG